MMRGSRRRNRAKPTLPLDIAVMDVARARGTLWSCHGGNGRTVAPAGARRNLAPALHQDWFFACRPGPPRLTHSATLLSMLSISAMCGILQWLVAFGGIAIRQSGPFIAARTAARH